MTLSEIRQHVDKQTGARELVLSDIMRLKEDSTAKAREMLHIEEAQTIIQTVAQQTQQTLEYRLGELVTLALAAVFGEGWKFRVQFTLRRGRTEADLLFEDENGHQIDPMTADGGGAVDVAALALRVSLWTLRHPRSRNTLIMDEPLRFLSTDLQARASTMLHELSERLGLQFIIVTHEEALLEAADKVFHVQNTKGSSRVCVL